MAIALVAEFLGARLVIFPRLSTGIIQESSRRLTAKVAAIQLRMIKGG